MDDPKPEGFQPAPWEAGKTRPVQPPLGPPPGPPPAPRPQGGYLGQPQPDAFGEGGMGRARTRQIQNQQPGPGPQPQPYQQPGPQPQPQPYQQQPAYPQPGPQGYPQQGYPPPGGQPQPAGMPPPYANMPMGSHKPTSIFAIVALVMILVGFVSGAVSLGIFSAPFFLLGAIFGYLGMRETAAWGKKAGRGMALGGTIANLVLLTLNGGWLLFGLLFAQSVGDSMKNQANAIADGMLLQQRLRMYEEAKGDLLPGGAQFKQGFANPTAAVGPMLQVGDLVSQSELNNPIAEYTLEVQGERATVYWQPPGGQRLEVAQYSKYGNFGDGFDDFEDSPGFGGGRSPRD